MRRILHLRTISGKGGGPEKTLLYTPRFLGDDYAVRLAYIRPANDPEYDMPERARQMGVSLIDIPERGPADPRTLVRLAREVRSFRPDVLHAHDYKTNILSVVLGRWFRIPVVTTLHGYGLTSGRLALYYRLEKWALRRMNRIVSVSPDLDQYLHDLKIPAIRRTVIENAIDVNTYRRRYTVDEAKARLGLPPQRLLVAGVGRLQPEKNFGSLIDAAVQLYGQGLDFDLAIIGDGPLREALQRQILEHGVESRVRLLGHRSDMIELFQAIDVFVLSSIREASPNVLLEAMAMGTPVVSTRVAGTPRIVSDGENGLLVTPNDTGGLGTAIANLLRNGHLRAKFSQTGRTTIEQEYSFDRRMKKMRALYDQILPSAACGFDAGNHTPKVVNAG